MNSRKLIHSATHSGFANSIKKKASDQGKQQLIALLKKNFLLQLGTALAAVTALSSAAFTLWTRTKKRLTRQLSASYPLQYSAQLQIRSQSCQEALQNARISVTCGVLTLDMSKANFASVTMLQCDVYMGVLILILPSHLKMDTKFHDYLGVHFCDAGRVIEGNPPLLQLRANTYLGAIQIQWAPSSS